MAQELNLDPISENKTRTFTAPELKKIRDLKTTCDIQARNYHDTQEALHECWDKGPLQQWYHEPSVIIGGMVLSFAVGAVVVYIIKEQEKKK